MDESVGVIIIRANVKSSLVVSKAVRHFLSDTNLACFARSLHIGFIIFEKLRTLISKMIAGV